MNNLHLFTFQFHKNFNVEFLRFWEETKIVLEIVFVVLKVYLSIRDNFQDI
jgi:hypothetical protein